MSDDTVLDTVNAVCVHLRGQGYRISHARAKRILVTEGLVPRRRGGGWSARAVEQWARGDHKIRRVVDDSAGADAPVAPSPGEITAQEQKAAADLAARRLEIRERELKVAEREGGLVPRDLYEKDLAARMALFSNQVDAYAQQAAKDIAALCGADLEAAAAMVEVVGGDQDKATELVGHVQGLVPEIMDLLLRRKADWLSSYARENVQVVELGEALERGEEVG